MSKKQPPDYALREEIALKIQKAITDNRLTYGRASELLEIRRQTLWLYLRKKATPGGEVLRRACRLWDITLSVKGFQFSEEAFATPRRTPSEALPQQLSLLDVLQTIREDQLEVAVVGRVGDAFEVKLRIKGIGLVPPRRRQA